MKKTIIIAVLYLAACTSSNNHFDLIEPEKLLAFSHEKISLPLTDSQSLNDIEQFINKDIPSKAEIVCGDEEILCHNAKKLFREKNIETSQVSATDSVEPYISLLYDRIIAKDCSDEKYFGCANAVNTIQMISSYKQLVKPDLIDPASADHLINNKKFKQLKNNKD